MFVRVRHVYWWHIMCTSCHDVTLSLFWRRVPSSMQGHIMTWLLGVWTLPVLLILKRRRRVVKRTVMMTRMIPRQTMMLLPRTQLTSLATLTQVKKMGMMYPSPIRTRWKRLVRSLWQTRTRMKAPLTEPSIHTTPRLVARLYSSWSLSFKDLVRHPRLWLTFGWVFGQRLRLMLPWTRRLSTPFITSTSMPHLVLGE